MAQSELYFKYIWLAELLYRNDGITVAEINRAWSLSHYNYKKEEIYPRKFTRYKAAIKDLFKIDITYSRRDRKYRISRPEDIDQNKFNPWILNSFAINSLLIESQDISDRILFEPIPSGQQFLTGLIESIRNNSVINIVYQSFHMDSPAPHIIEPYCLKVYNQRWYVLGRRTDINKMRIFSLDRVKDIVPTGDRFKLPDDFDAESYFYDSVGIIVEEDRPAQKVLFKVSGGQQDYIRSLPIHHSQREIKKDANESTFELYVKPSYDLIQELLRFGEDVKIVAPKWFQGMFQKTAERMYNNYNHI